MYSGSPMVTVNSLEQFLIDGPIALSIRKIIIVSMFPSTAKKWLHIHIYVCLLLYTYVEYISYILQTLWLKNHLKNKHEYIRSYVAKIQEINGIVSNNTGFEVKMLRFESLLYHLKCAIFLPLPTNFLIYKLRNCNYVSAYPYPPGYCQH